MEKKEGDRVKKGDILFILETEKVTYEVEAHEDGIMGPILVKEKAAAPVGGIVAYLLKEGERWEEIRAPDGGKEKKIEVDHPSPSTADKSPRMIDQRLG